MCRATSPTSPSLNLEPSNLWVLQVIRVVLLGLLSIGHSIGPMGRMGRATGRATGRMGHCMGPFLMDPMVHSMGHVGLGHLGHMGLTGPTGHLGHPTGCTGRATGLMGPTGCAMGTLCHTLNPEP
jgi:hypothetical protein